MTEEKENINIGLMWKLAGGKNNSQYKQGEQSLEPDWDKLAQEADQSIEGKTNNQFHMVDKLFKKMCIRDRATNSAVNRMTSLTPFFYAAIIYLLMTFVLTLIAGRLEKYFSRYDAKEEW